MTWSRFLSRILQSFPPPHLLLCEDCQRKPATQTIRHTEGETRLCGLCMEKFSLGVGA